MLEKGGFADNSLHVRVFASTMAFATWRKPSDADDDNGQIAP
jgi:hypothetical protein